MITLKDITLSYGSRTLLAASSAHFAAGSLTALVGRNGAGKSTLLRAISGITRPQSGEILLDNRAVATLSPQQLARTVGFVGTEKVRIANLLCEDIVAIGRSPYTNWIGRMQRVDCDIVAASLRAVGMETFALRPVDTLSDGECQRIMIARVLAQQTPVILLDEPTAFLDVPTRFEICRLLQRLVREENKCVIFSTHDLDSALAFCDTVAIIDNLSLRTCTADEVRHNAILEDIFGIVPTPKPEML